MHKDFASLNGGEVIEEPFELDRVFDYGTAYFHDCEVGIGSFRSPRRRGLVVLGEGSDGIHRILWE